MQVSCLFKGQSLLHKPITARDSGAVLAYVHDIVFDHDQNQVLAFLADPRRRVESLVLPWSGIYSVTSEGIVTHNAEMLTQGINLLAVRQVFARTNVRRGTHLILGDGRSLGRVQDIYFDAHGVIEGYATTGGELAPGVDVAFVPAPRRIRVVGRQALLPTDHLRMLQENPAARRRLVFGLKLLAQNLWHTYADAVGEQLKARAHEVPLEPLANELAREAVHLVEGCRVQHTVHASDSCIAVIASQIVTARGIERARACSREREVLIAAGADPLHALRTAMDGNRAPA